MENEQHKKRKSKTGIGLPMFLIAAGLLWLASSLGISIDWTIVLPSGVILLGLFYLIERRAIDSFLVMIVIILLIGGTLFSFSSNFFPDIFHSGLRFGGNRIEEKTTQHDIPADSYGDVEKLNLDVDIGSGTYALTTEVDEVHILTSTARFNYSELEPILTSKVTGTTLDVSYKTENKGLFFATDVISEYTMNLGDKTLPTELTAELGSGKSTIALSDYLMTKTNLTIGSGVMVVTASGVNTPEHDIVFGVGSGKLTLEGLGSANLASLSGEFGSGSVELDFSGGLAGSRIPVDIDGGSGSMAIIIPDEIGFAINSDVGSGRVTVDGEKASDGDFTSDNYEAAEVSLNFDIDLGSGTISVRTE